MSSTQKINLLRIALVIIGFLFTIGLCVLMRYWPGGFAWEPRQYEYEQMILGIYATLGIFLFIAAINPLKHLSLIWFTAISSIVHAAIMLIQAIVDKTETANIYGDVAALFIIGIVLVILTPIRSQN